MQPADQVAAFLVGVFGHRTAVDYADIGFGRRGHALEAPFGKLPGVVSASLQFVFPAGEITKFRSNSKIAELSDKNIWKTNILVLFLDQ